MMSWINEHAHLFHTSILLTTTSKWAAILPDCSFPMNSCVIRASLGIPHIHIWRQPFAIPLSGHGSLSLLHSPRRLNLFEASVVSWTIVTNLSYWRSKLAPLYPVLITRTGVQTCYGFAWFSLSELTTRIRLDVKSLWKVFVCILPSITNISFWVRNFFSRGYLHGHDCTCIKILLLSGVDAAVATDQDRCAMALVRQMRQNGNSAQSAQIP